MPRLSKAYVTSKVEPIDGPTPLMETALGRNGIDRLNRFMELEDGWDSGRGRAFSKASLGVFELFLQTCTGCSIRDPSIFLTANGNLQLEWDDREGNACEIEFFPDHLDYHFEGTDEEGRCDLEEAPSLVGMIRKKE